MGPIGNHLWFIDSRTRHTRFLYPSSETSFFSCPSIGIPFPVELRVTFLKNKQGKVSGLIWKENGSRPITGKRLPYNEEEVSYKYGDATVTAKLLVTATAGLHPAMIDIGQGYFLGPDNGPGQEYYICMGFDVIPRILITFGRIEP